MKRKLEGKKINSEEKELPKNRLLYNFGNLLPSKFLFFIEEKTPMRSNFSFPFQSREPKIAPISKI